MFLCAPPHPLGVCGNQGETMSSIKVTYHDLEETAKKLKDGQGVLERKLDELRGLVDTLVGAGFQTGSASGAFQTSYSEFNKGATTTIGGLEGLSTFLTKAAAAYKSTDEELGKALKG